MAPGGSRRARNALLASLAAASTLFSAACSGGPGGTTSLTTEAATPTASAAPTLVPTAVATNAAGIRTCVSSSQGPEEECRLDQGTYATEFMTPGLTYTVPSAGWASLNREAAPGNFHLFPPGGSMAGFSTGVTDDITLVSSVVAPGACTGTPSTTRPATFDGLVKFLTTDSHVVVSNIRDTSVGGLGGKVMDIAFKEGDGCHDGVYTDLMIGVDRSHGAFGVTPLTAGARLILLHVAASDKALAIMVDDARGGGSNYGDGAAWYTAAQGVIDTFVFTP